MRSGWRGRRTRPFAVAAPRRAVIPRPCGYPGRGGCWTQSLAPPKYWIASPSAQWRTRRAMTARGCGSAFSRHEMPEPCVIRVPLSGKRAQGRPGARCTRGLACHPDIAFLVGGQDHRHGLGMDRLDHRVRRCREKTIDLMRPRHRLRLRAAITVERRPDASEGKQRAGHR